jgi:hypothetical protein
VLDCWINKYFEVFLYRSRGHCLVLCDVFLLFMRCTVLARCVSSQNETPLFSAEVAAVVVVVVGLLVVGTLLATKKNRARLCSSSKPFWYLHSHNGNHHHCPLPLSFIVIIIIHRFQNKLP